MRRHNSWTNIYFSPKRSHYEPLHQVRQPIDRKVREMTSEKPWARTFRISPQQIAEWEDIAPADVPLAVWAIEAGHIDAEEFLNWAQEFYSLPVVKSEFFASDVPFDRPDGQWQPWLVPVNEWDGTLFVACAEPPQDFSYHQPVQFVLANPMNLAKVFSKSDVPSPGLEMPEGLSQIYKKPVLQLGEEFETPAAMPPMQTPKAQQPLPSEVQPQTSPSIVLNLKKKNNLDEDLDAKTVVTSSQVAFPAVDLEASQTRMTALKSNIPSLPDMPPVPSSSQAPTKPAKPTKAPTPPSEDLSQVTAVTLVSKVKLPPAPPSLDQAKNLESAFAWAFAQVTGRYSHAMALQETNSQMLPWLWTPNWRTPEKINSKATSLDQPSLFRIAGKTRRPYHGFIVESDIHKQFFNSWGFATLPPCATAIPIVVLDHVWGLLLCVGDESSESPEALKLAEATAEKIADFIRSHLAAA